MEAVKLTHNVGDVLSEVREVAITSKNRNTLVRVGTKWCCAGCRDDECGEVTVGR